MREVPCILNLMTTGLETSLHRPGWDFWETSAKPRTVVGPHGPLRAPKHPSGATERGSGEAPGAPALGFVLYLSVLEKPKHFSEVYNL